ncbi:MAG: DUF1801 domain-containing protein [Leptospira sp.]|nr:DUF1801 domain-containing protein [Leptospira sp.]
MPTLTFKKPKTNPIQTDIDVTNFLSSHKHPLKAVIEEIRDLILKTDKSITEHIKWNAPSFCYLGDDRITFRLDKSENIQLIFHTGAKGKDTKTNQYLFEDETRLLVWLADKRAVVTFVSFEDYMKKKTKFKKIVKRWLAETM